MKSLRPLLIVVVIDVLGFGILIPLMPYLAERLGASPALITPILGVYSLFQFVAAPIWGRLSDTYGRRPILISSMCGACLSYLLLAVAHSLPMLFASRVLAGAMAGNISAAMAYGSDVSPPDQRARALGMIGAAIGTGFMLGPAIGGLLAGNDIATANFVRPALVAASLSIVAMLLVVFRLPESHTPSARAALAASGQRSHPWALLLKLPRLRWIVLATFLAIYSQSTLDSSFVIWVVGRYHMGPRTVSLALFGVAVLAVATQGGLVRRLVPALGEARVALMGVAGYVSGLLVLVAWPAIPGTILGRVLFAFGSGMFMPAAAALASQQSGPDNRGAVMGAFQSGSSLARVIAPFIAGPLYEAIAPGAPYLLAAVVTIPAFWCIWRANKHGSA